MIVNSLVKKIDQVETSRKMELDCCDITLSKFFRVEKQLDKRYHIRWTHCKVYNKLFHQSHLMPKSQDDWKDRYLFRYRYHLYMVYHNNDLVLSVRELADNYFLVYHIWNNKTDITMKFCKHRIHYLVDGDDGMDEVIKWINDNE